MRAVVTVVTVAVAVTTASARADDLWQVFQTALERDAVYAAAGYELKSARLTLPLARTALLPSLSAQGVAARTRSDDAFVAADGTRDDDTEYRSSLDADLTLLDVELLRAYRQAKLQVAAAEINFNDARADLILRVAGRYFELLAAIDNREVARRQRASIKRQMDFAEQRYEVGLGTRADLFDAQARFQLAAADVIAADNRIDNAEQALTEITGEATTGASPALSPLTDDAPLPPPSPPTVTAWVARALANNLALQAEDLNLKVAAEEIKRQRAARLPKLDLRVRRQWRESDALDNPNNVNTETDTTSVEATVNWDLFDGGAIFLRAKDAGHRYNAALQNREELKRRIASDTTSAYLAVVSNASRVRALADAIRAGESALAAKEEGFRAGLTTNLDVLDAQRDLARSRTDHLAARYDFILATLRLERAAGDLDQADLKRINAWLE